MIKSMIVAFAALAASFSAVQAQDGATLARIKSSGVLKVGLAEAQPLAVKNPGTGEWEGMNADLAKDLARVLGVKVQFVDTNYATMIAGLGANQFDIIMAPAFATPERALSVLFTNTYMTTGEVVLVHKDSSAKEYSDLNKAGISFAELAGTTNEKTARQFFPNAEVRALVTENQVAPMMEVANGRVQAHVSDQNSIERFIKNNPNASVRLLKGRETINKTRRAFMIKPGDYHFLNFLNTWIDGLEGGGQLAQIKEKYGVN